jgi:hypothetical protein
MKRAIFTAINLLVFSFSSFGQSQNRIIYFDRDDVSGKEGVLRIMKFEVSNKLVSFNEPFEASSDWLRTLKLTVKNTSQKPIIYIGVGFGLLDAIDGKLEPFASYQYGISYNYGTPTENVGKDKPNPVLRPNDEAVLIYEKVGVKNNNLVIEKAGIGRFHQAKFMVAAVQFADGTFEYTQAVQ